MSKCPLEHHRDELDWFILQLSDLKALSDKGKARLKDILRIWRSAVCPPGDCRMPACRYYGPHQLAEYHGYVSLGELVDTLAKDLRKPLRRIPQKISRDALDTKGAVRKWHYSP
jgi:hypothetical protein